MRVIVHLVGPFRIGRFKEAVHVYPPGSRVSDVVNELDIPMQLLGIVLINSLHASVDDLINDGDKVCLLPFIDGG